jgi:hypothetical protein
MYNEPFSSMTSADLLRFSSSQADTVLGNDGNAWLRLYDVALAGVSRSASTEDCELYALVASRAVEGMRLYTQFPEKRRVLYGVKARVAYVLKCQNSSEWKVAEAAALVECFLEQALSLGETALESYRSGLLVGSELADAIQIRNMAAQVSRINEYLPFSSYRLIDEWARVGRKAS